MTILGIVSTVSVVSLASLGDTRDAAAARRMLHDLSYARELALSLGLRTWVKFNVPDQKYSLLVESAASPGMGSVRELVDPATGFAYVQLLDKDDFRGVRITDASIDGGAYLGFDWMGAPLNSAEQPIASKGVISLSGGHIVVIEPQSGTITLGRSP